MQRTRSRRGTEVGVWRQMVEQSQHGVERFVWVRYARHALPRYAQSVELLQATGVEGRGGDSS